MAKEYSMMVAGQARPIYVPETQDDIHTFMQWVKQPRHIMAIDTETSSLYQFTPGFMVRLVQFGDGDSAWVIPVCAGWNNYIRKAILDIPKVAMHNAPFDILALEAAGLSSVEELQFKVRDTSIMAHLLDPRQEKDGGLGLHLKNLANYYVDPSIKDGELVLKAYFKSMKWKIKDGYRLISIEHPDYIRYAGLDVLATTRLYDALHRKLKQGNWLDLAMWEHKVAGICMKLERRGFLLDVDYTHSLSGVLHEQWADYAAQAAREAGNWIELDAQQQLFDMPDLSVASSNAKIIEVLTAQGAKFSEFTPTGQPAVDRHVLLELAENGNKFAELVMAAKHAAKYRSTYAEGMLSLRDLQNRIHPKIHSLQARTARMSISEPPLQQLPSNEWLVRRALVADPGQLIIAADYAQVELRILAALADERQMKAAIAEGQDLHDFTANLMFGEEFTKAQRKLAKNTGFGRVYGGGAKTLARQADVELGVAEAASKSYDARFPAVKRYSRRLMYQAQANDLSVTTPMGRKLPVDEDRLYSGLNYMIQSTARDVLADALLRLDKEGLEPYLLVPVHDEVVAQAPAEIAQNVADHIAEVMQTNFLGVHLASESSVHGKSWGHGYGAPE
jgi:DNA polymerase-1